MGIKDLLRFMKPYIEPVHIKKYAGKRVGIDAYSWLHKGAYSCSMELCLDSNSERKLRYIDYFMHRVNLLRFYKITPVVVFDGCNVPCKAATEEERNRQKRRANRELAMAKLKEGNVGAASELFQRAVSITPVMAHKLIQTLKSEKIEFVVAPYEADAQLAYMSQLGVENGGVAAVITEDSDLIAYGCPAIIFKMDRHGNGERIELEKVFSAESGRPSFRSFNMKLLTGMCVLAGCDFLPSVPGIGIARAHALVSKYRNLDRILSVLKIEKGDQMPEDYAKSFQEAVAVFEHAQIYDVNSKELKHMNPLPENFLGSLDGKFDFLGPLSDKDKYSNEALALHKLIMPLGNNGTEEKTIISDFTPLKFPDNNPFRIRKNEGTYQTKDTVQKVSFASNMGYTDLCMSPDDFEEKGSENLSRKRKFQNFCSDKVEATDELFSGVTEVEKSDIPCMAVESPESINSDQTKKIADLKGRSESNKQSKRSNSKKTGSNNITLLSFFSRV
ncbi:Exonuclease 1 [Glycine soja]|uniref:Exonuclease 1 n=1 Tax=Glycine soja TaxID=3848 RepID=A0A0B2SJY1_GLYSO|nr:Exonuclease 1 [Glycine soja]